MALFFDLIKLEAVSKGLPQSIYSNLERYYNVKALSKYNLAGGSFILSPAKLFKDKATDIIYKVQYIRLAGRRDYASYRLYGTKSLDLSLYPDINISNIRNNPLLHIKNNQIHFLYED